MKNKKCLICCRELIENSDDICEEHFEFYFHKFGVESKEELISNKEFTQLLHEYEELNGGKLKNGNK